MGLGQASERKILTCLLSASSRRAREHLPTSSSGRPPNQDERELIVDRQSCQLVPQAATSLIVACDPDGRGAVCSRRSLSVCQRGRTSQPRLSRCSHQSSRSALFQKGPAIYQLVYESHFFGGKRRCPRGTAQVMSASPRRIAVWPPPAPENRSSSAPSRPDVVCRGADG